MRSAAMSVTQLNEYIKILMDSDDLLASAVISGEISNFKYHSATGHLYFTLKDENSSVSAVMFRGNAVRLSFKPRDGAKVTVYGSVSVYPKTGQYQIYVQTMVDEGLGNLYREFERLRTALTAEGLFDRVKRALPKFPRRVGIITSPTGAVIRDILSVSGRRFPSAEILLYSASVQGASAVPELMAGLKYFSETGSADVIIIGRGGGSIEDLWAFNDERLVRLVAECKVPVISAVGHETDFTLCDFAADLRAATPSAAAELAFPDGRLIMQGIAAGADRLDLLMAKKIGAYDDKIKASEKTLERLSPAGKTREAREKTARLLALLNAGIEAKFTERETGLKKLSSRLHDLSPLSVLSRGFTLVRDAGGGVVASSSAISAGDKIEVIFADGKALASVETVFSGKGKDSAV